jgi:hypothetical protein
MMSLAALTFSAAARNDSSATTPSNASKRIAMAFGSKLPLSFRMRLKACLHTPGVAVGVRYPLAAEIADGFQSPTTAIGKANTIAARCREIVLRAAGQSAKSLSGEEVCPERGIDAGSEAFSA